MYNYIIIGAGISGLYLGYKLKNENFLIIDKNNYIGGRIKVTDFYGSKINLGAGFFLERHNTLKNLLKELDIEYNTTASNTEFLGLNGNLKIIYQEINNNILKYYNKDIPNITFLEFINIYFDKEIIDLIKKYNDYDEFWNMNIHTVINKYNISEIITEKIKNICFIKGGWQVLINKLKYILEKNISLNTEIIKIIKNENKYTIMSKNKKYETTNLIICGDYTCKNIEMIGIDELFINILTNIIPQSSLRIYAKHEKYQISHSLRSENILFKLIPISDIITMICYNDDIKANLIYNFIKNNNMKLLEEMVNNTFEINLKITDITFAYWENAIHYMNPRISPIFLDKYYSLSNEIFKKYKFLLLGEFVNDNELGYVENALLSIDKFLSS
jgi:hypothetical protein